MQKQECQYIFQSQMQLLALHLLYLVTLRIFSKDLLIKENLLAFGNVKRCLSTKRRGECCHVPRSGHTLQELSTMNTTWEQGSPRAEEGSWGRSRIITA